MLHITIDYTGDSTAIKKVYERILKGFLNLEKEGYLVERYDLYGDNTSYKKVIKITPKL